MSINENQFKELCRETLVAYEPLLKSYRDNLISGLELELDLLHALLKRLRRYFGIDVNSTIAGKAIPRIPESPEDKIILAKNEKDDLLSELQTMLFERSGNDFLPIIEKNFLEEALKKSWWSKLTTGKKE
jgi:hypothetical protein